MSVLIHAAEAALTQLRHLHEEAIKAATEKHAAETRSGVVLYGCPGSQHCATAAAIQDLEAEIARAKLPPAACDSEFQAVAPFTIKEV